MSDAGISNKAPHSSQPADIPREEPADSDSLDFHIDRPFDACGKNRAVMSVLEVVFKNRKDEIYARY